MSTDYNVYCKTCEEIHYFNDANHRDDLMRGLIRHAKTIADMHEMMQDVQEIAFQTPYGMIDTAWFVKHREHELVVIDEYGRFLNQCIYNVKCEGCTKTVHCMLSHGHEGPHSGIPTNAGIV